MTTLVLLSSLGGRLFYAWVANEEKKVVIKKIFRSVGVIGVVLFSLAGWYYLLWGTHVWGYFYQNTFGLNKSFWSLKGNWVDWMTYYFNGRTLESNFGRLGVIISFAMAGFCIWKCIIGSWLDKLHCFLLASLGVLIYGMLAVANVKHALIGAPVYMFIIFTAAYFLNDFYLRSSSLSKRFATISIIVFALITALFFQTWPYHSNWSERKPIVRHTFREATYSFIDVLQSIKPFPKSILYVHAGPVLSDVVQIAMLRNHQNPAVHCSSFCRNMDEFYGMQKSNEVIVVPDSNAKGMPPQFPIISFLPDIVKSLDSDPEFSLFHTIRTTDGSLIYVYIRKESMLSKAAQGGV